MVALALCLLFGFVLCSAEDQQQGGLKKAVKYKVTTLNAGGTNIQELQNIARNIAAGALSCYATENYKMEHFTTEPVRCPYEGAKFDVNGTGASMRRKRAAVPRAPPPAPTHPAAPALRTPPPPAQRFEPQTPEQTGFGNCAPSKTDNSLNSIYVEEIIGNYRVISTNGIPDHSYDQSSVNIPCEHYKILFVPLQPALLPDNGIDLLGKGPVGLAKSGSAFYDHLTDYPICSTAYITNNKTFGTCKGHANNQKEWHYHGPSGCLKDSQGGDCSIVGYMTDGFPVRAECPNQKSCYKLKSGLMTCTATVTDGVGKSKTPNTIFPGCDAEDFIYMPDSACQLDEASFSAEDQSYYLTTTFPFSIRGLRGDSDLGSMCVVQLPPAAV